MTLWRGVLFRTSSEFSVSAFLTQSSNSPSAKYRGEVPFIPRQSNSLSAFIAL